LTEHTGAAAPTRAAQAGRAGQAGRAEDVRPAPLRVGWDIGGAHVKACLLQDGRVADVAQWACPLWQGLQHLDKAYDQASARWPALHTARHGVTMTGEMADLFAHREEGVCRIAASFTARWGAAATRFYAGDAGWCSSADVSAQWAHIASANWLATAQHVAQCVAGEGVLVDIGSTTTDLIAFRHGQVLTRARSDAARLASGELAYHGVVRTPLCALGPQVPFGGQPRNVMNEFFATTADVYRLTGELDPTHDMYPAADSAGKDSAATRQRLARMIGLDARDATAAEWLAFAHAWRDRQVAELQRQWQRVATLHGLGPDAQVVSAGAGGFLVGEVAGGRPTSRYVEVVAGAPGKGELLAEEWAERAQLCAPSVAVAWLMVD